MGNLPEIKNLVSCILYLVCLVHSVHLCVPLVTICWYTIFTMQCTISACIVNLSSSLIYIYIYIYIYTCIT